MHFCSQPETACDVISCAFVGPIARDKHVKFRDPHLTVLEKFHLRPSRQHFQLLFRDNFRTEVVSDVISDKAVE